MKFEKKNTNEFYNKNIFMNVKHKVMTSQKVLWEFKCVVKKFGVVIQLYILFNKVECVLYMRLFQMCNCRFNALNVLFIFTVVLIFYSEFVNKQ